MDRHLVALTEITFHLQHETFLTRALHIPQKGAPDVVLIRCIQCHRVELSIRWHWMHFCTSIENGGHSRNVIFEPFSLRCHLVPEGLVIKNPPMQKVSSSNLQRAYAKIGWTYARTRCLTVAPPRMQCAPVAREICS